MYVEWNWICVIMYTTLLSACKWKRVIVCFGECIASVDLLHKVVWDALCESSSAIRRGKHRFDHELLRSGTRDPKLMPGSEASGYLGLMGACVTPRQDESLNPGVIQTDD
ncbi:hypothetical protein L798_14567 [Zootermopsis nevadensis]|uniref:Uncharacterized protein n=1 Tax=Zootermopsis nevadensis TaxID=136037 RepID=A0A067QZA6_ZOONE|nr:hypothetical protein L798_14567 [Zootermopsis nevadensis]